MKQISLKEGWLKIKCCNDCPICHCTDMGDLECGLGGVEITDCNSIPEYCHLPDFEISPYTKWQNEILIPCTAFTVIDQGLARCNHEDHHWQWCEYEKCPKVER